VPVEDSEAGVKKEEDALKAKLKNLNPPKLTVASTVGGKTVVIDIAAAQRPERYLPLVYKVLN
jgi:hypothetical protein